MRKALFSFAPAAAGRGWLTDTLTRLALEHLDLLTGLGIDPTVGAILVSAAIYAGLHGAVLLAGAVRRWLGRRRDA